MLLSIASLLVPISPQQLNYQWTFTCKWSQPLFLGMCEFDFVKTQGGLSNWWARKGKLCGREKCLKPEGPGSLQSPTEVPGRCWWLTGGLQDAVCRKFSLVLFGNQAFALTLVPAYKIGTGDLLVQMGQALFPPLNDLAQRDNVPSSCHTKILSLPALHKFWGQFSVTLPRSKICSFHWNKICELVADNKKCWSHREKS